MIKAAIHHLSAKGVGKKIGYVTLSDTVEGLLLEPEISGLVEGEHGFHVHEFGDLEPKDGKAAGMAGQHYDPQKTGKHLGPYRNGHKGDLPVLIVDEDGIARTPVIAPRLTLAEVEGRALIIHSGGDNYSDTPIVNGGGKSRIAGGVITNKCPYCMPTWQKVALAGLVGFALWRKK
jgi:Cu-Zn family superoxide dismutase